jgi:hypothetical protein
MAPDIDEGYVRCAAAAIGLDISAERLDGVLDNLRRIAAISAPVLAVGLEPTDEMAPVWRP